LNATAAGADEVTMLPPKKKPRGSSVYLMDETWDALQEIADETKGQDPHGIPYTRNDVIQSFLDWAIREYRKEQGPSKKSR
jgi:hypothetical protein